jgi:hypothetical protein
MEELNTQKEEIKGSVVLKIRTIVEFVNEDGK